MTNSKNLFSLLLFAFAVSFSSISFACSSCSSQGKSDKVEAVKEDVKEVNVLEVKSVDIKEEKEEVKVPTNVESKSDEIVPVKKERTALAKNDVPPAETEKVGESEDVSDEIEDNDSDDDNDEDFEFDEAEFKKSLEAFSEMFKDGAEPENSTTPLTA